MRGVYGGAAKMVWLFRLQRDCPTRVVPAGKLPGIAVEVTDVGSSPQVSASMGRGSPQSAVQFTNL